MRRAANVAAVIPSAVAGGAVAAAVDVILASPELGRFLAGGPYSFAVRLWAFLFSLYGAIASVTFGLAGFGLFLLGRYTLLSRLGKSEHRDQKAPAPVAWWALLAGTSAAVLFVSATLYFAAKGALLRFHHPGLIAVLVATEAAGLAILGGALALSVLALCPPAQTGRGWLPSFSGPPSLYAVGWTLGLASFSGGIAGLLLWLEKNPRPLATLLPLYLSLATPVLALVAFGVGHGLGRALAGWAKRFDKGRPSWLHLRLALFLLPSLVPIFCALLVASAYAQSLRLLDWRPVRTAAVGLLAAVLCFWPLARLDKRRLLFALLLPPLLYGAALHLGHTERVRKAALFLAPLSEHIILALARTLDFDGDGVAGRFAIGGSDCDDLDFERHPGAFDWPDNGIDENCNGHDATARRAPAPGAPAALPAPLVPRPNIVLITIDALRADHVSAYGYGRRTTPALDALAADPDGVLFENAWAHAPSTRYSVPAILTGRYPSAISWGPPHLHWPPEVLPENRLLSEMLAERGYHTTALLSYHYFERGWGLGQGFSDYDTHLLTLHSLGGDPAATNGSSARELADLAIQKLSALVPAANERPFFLWIHFYDPHYRYEPHPPPPGETAFGNGHPTEMDLYDGEIRYTDQHLSRVLDFLRESAAWPRTLVMVTADHGEGFGEHGLGPDRRHGYHLYANQTRVPLILRVPGLAQAAAAQAVSTPRRPKTPVGHIDIAPTLLHLASGHDPASFEPQLLGTSLVPRLLAPKDDPNACVFQEVMYEGPTVRKALASARWHFIENLIPDGTTELYDLRRDPGEEHDVFEQHPQEESALAARLAAWLDDSAVPENFAQRLAGNLSMTPISGTQKVGATIGDVLDVVASDAPGLVTSRGNRVELAVIYQVRQRIPAGYRLFVHLRGESGGFLNLDHDFIDGLVPPQKLRPGQFVRDVTHVTIPPWFPRGPARLLVGLFHRNGRAQVAGPQNVALQTDRAVHVATLDIR